MIAAVIARSGVRESWAAEGPIASQPGAFGVKYEKMALVTRSIRPLSPGKK